MRREIGLSGLWSFGLFGLTLLFASHWQSSPAQAFQQVTFGFDNVATPFTTGDERTSQTNLWVLEAQFKSLRMRLVELPDLKTGEIKKEPVIYFVFRVINRGLGETKDESDTDPTNKFDQEVAAPQFVPEMTLVTNDNDQQKIYPDIILPAAQKIILDREKSKLPPGVILKNLVEISGKIPEITPSGANAKQTKALYGVALWRGIDPEADYFTIMISGFSNGYKLVRGPVDYQALVDRVKDGKLTFSDQIWDGKTTWKAASETYNLFNDRKPAPADTASKIWFYTTTHDRVTKDEEKPIVWRKTLIQRFWRPGDGIDPQEVEFKLKGEPEWIYQPDDVQIPVAAPPNDQPAPKKPLTAKPAAAEKMKPADDTP
ncbi:MAG: hypothetical protein NT013_14070 [Planctomycetia bacterium]|nr:hypothetical protein [Planctomycetia bacterium]